MKILVTGGAGRVGLPLVELLLAQGHEVTAAGRSADRQVPGASYLSLDITQFEPVREAVAAHQRVIHLAAIPSPGRTPDALLFHINCQGTFNVLSACVAAGVDHVSVASSINALGQKYGRQPWPVRYFPVDEDHPSLTSDVYSLSKQFTDELCQYFWRKDRLSSISLRIPAVLGPHWLERWRAHDPDDVARRLADDFWVVIDERDCADAFARAAEPCYEGSHTCFVNDTRNAVGRPSRALAAEFYPGVTQWRAPVEADEALVSPARFMALTGWRPRFGSCAAPTDGP